MEINEYEALSTFTLLFFAVCVLIAFVKVNKRLSKIEKYIENLKNKPNLSHAS